MPLFRKKTPPRSQVGPRHTPGENPEFDVAFAQYNRLVPLIQSVLTAQVKALSKYGNFQLMLGNPASIILNGSPNGGSFFELIVRLRKDSDETERRRSQGLRTSPSGHYLGVMNYTTYKEHFLMLDEVNEALLTSTVQAVTQDQLGKFAAGAEAYAIKMRDQANQSAGYWIQKQNEEKKKKR